jgi:hypothetical protein
VDLGILNIATLILVYQLFIIFKRINHKLVFIEIIGLFANLQWLICPLLIDQFISKGYIDTRIYNQNLNPQFKFYAFLCVLFFLLGIELANYLFKSDTLLLKKKILLAGIVNDKIKNTLFLISILSVSVADFVGEFKFVFIALGDLLYVYFILLFISFSKRDKYYFLIGLVYLIFKTLLSGMFGSIFIWLFVIFNYYNILYPISNLKKIQLFIIGILAILFLQTIKSDFRSKTWYSSSIQTETDKIYEFNALINKTSFNLDIETFLPTLIRLNQGFIVSKVMDNVPSVVPFENGNTIFIDLQATLLPRIIWPDKPTSGGSFNFKKYVNQELVGQTSMNIGPIGESWVNFGLYGGALFLFVYSFILCFLLQYIVRKTDINSNYILFLPLYVVHVLSVETDFLNIFNAIFKVTLILISLQYFLKKSLNK